MKRETWHKARSGGIGPGDNAAPRRSDLAHEWLGIRELREESHGTRTASEIREPVHRSPQSRCSFGQELCGRIARAWNARLVFQHHERGHDIGAMLDNGGNQRPFLFLIRV